MPQAKKLAARQVRAEAESAVALGRTAERDPSTARGPLDLPFHEDMPAIMHSIDREGRLVAVTDHWLAVMGYAREEVIGRGSSEFLTPESRRKALDVTIPAFLRSGHCENVSYQFVTKSGQVRDMLLSAKAKRDDEGRFDCSLAILTDVTEQRQAERALAENEARLRAILQDQTEFICRYQMDTTLTFVNKAFCRYFGKSEQELLGSTFTDLFPEDSREGILNHIGRLQPGKPVTYQHQSRTREGNLAWQQWTDRAIAGPDGEIIEFQSVGRDITSSRRQQLTLRRLHEITASQSLILVEKLDEMIRLGLDHFGLENGVISEVAGTNYTVRHAVSSLPALRPGATFKLDETYCAYTLRRGRPFALEHVATSDLGREPAYRQLQLEAYVAAPITVEGETRGTLAFSSPSPSTRSFGAEDLETVALLAQWLGLQIQTGEKQQELERSNADLEQFAYVASHDLMEPLRTVRSFCDLLQQRYGDQLGGEAEEFMTFIVDGAERMQGLVSDLLSYSRVGTKGRDFEPIDSDDVLDQALKNLTAALDQEDISIERGELPRICADEIQILQVLQNLIGNAVKFRREAPLTIRISAEDLGNEWRFAVADNGMGIDRKFADRIFQVFQRLHSRDAVEGSGIGLSICKRVVERHGGRIWVRSAKGEGSTFYFTLPKAP